MAFSDNFSIISGFYSDIKDRIFGENNSHIESLLDYFYSLRQEKRAKIILYMIFSFIIFLLIIILIYFLSLNSLRNKLNTAVHNTRQLNNFKTNFADVNNDFNQLVAGIKNNNQNSSLVSALDQKSKDLGVETSALPEKPPLIDLPSTHPLFSQFQKIKIDYTLPSISLRKTIEYVYAIEQMPNKFKVLKLVIQQKFGTKLYFDVNLTVEAYVPVQKKNLGDK